MFKFGMFLCKCTVITLTVILYDMSKPSTYKDSSALLDKTLSLLNSTLQEVVIYRKMIRGPR